METSGGFVLFGYLKGTDDSINATASRCNGVEE
jgi:hypothetical protein